MSGGRIFGDIIGGDIRSCDIISGDVSSNVTGGCGCVVGGDVRSGDVGSDVRSGDGAGGDGGGGQLLQEALVGDDCRLDEGDLRSEAELGTWGIFEFFPTMKNDFFAFFIKLIPISAPVLFKSHSQSN